MNATKQPANHIPQALRDRPQWVAWRFELNPCKDKPNKVPYDPNTGERAKPNDPTTWGTFEQAVELRETKGLNGIGYVFSADDPYTGIDLDACRDPFTGVIEPWAQEIIDAHQSYTEASPSLTGVHILVEAKLPITKTKHGGIEIFCDRCYFTVSDIHIEGTPPSIEPRQATSSPPLSDADILSLTRRASNQIQFAVLYDRGVTSAYGGDESAADLALCGLLAFYTQDPEQLDRLFQASTLMRPKWDERHAGDGRTYGEMTIAKALKGATEHYTGGGPYVNTGVVDTVDVDDKADDNSADLGEASTAAPPPEPHSLRVPEAGLIGVARDFADLYASYLETPRSFFYFGFLTYLGAVIAKKVTVDSELDIEPRLYTVVVGDSADLRKSTGARKSDEFFQDVAPHLVVLHGVGSAEGLARELQKSPTLLLHFDELMSFVAKAKIENSELLPMVAKLFERDEYDNATKAKNVRVRGAAISLIGACTLDTYESVYSSEFINLGFPNRIGLVADRTGQRIAFPQRIPADQVRVLKRRVRALLAEIDEAYRANGNEPVVYPLTPEARQIFEAWYMRRVGSVFEKRLDTYGHRLALLLAVSAGKQEIDAEVMQAVVALLQWQLAVRRECDPIDAENLIAKIEGKIRKELRKRAALKLRDLQRACNYSRYGIWAWEQALNNLIRTGEGAVNRKTEVYSLTDKAPVAA